MLYLAYIHLLSLTKNKLTKNGKNYQNHLNSAENCIDMIQTSYHLIVYGLNYFNV